MPKTIEGVLTAIVTPFTCLLYTSFQRIADAVGEVVHRVDAPLVASLVAVSYTNLDVYKRQAFIRGQFSTPISISFKRLFHSWLSLASFSAATPVIPTISQK